MRNDSPDIGRFEHRIFHKKNVLAYLLSFARKLMEARQAGLIFGTDASRSHFLPPHRWDRGVMDKFIGRGVEGIFLKAFGRYMVRLKKMSPIHLYRINELGERVDKDGVLAYTLRHHQSFYNKGIKILLINTQAGKSIGPGASHFNKASVVTYDGVSFNPLKDILTDTEIVCQFKSKNFVAAYIPDYGAIALNTILDRHLIQSNGTFLYGDQLRQRLDILICAIKTASLAYLASAKGRSAAKMIWRKERRLRHTADRLKEKQGLLDEQKKYLMAVGAVTAEQLAMEPVSIHDGVYAFMDMVGSVKVSKSMNPRDYFRVLNACHEVAADNSARFGCRVDNIIGDAVFFENVSVFDGKYSPSAAERLMLMTCLLASVFNEINQLKKGHHPMDRDLRVSSLVKTHGVDIAFRGGMTYGKALIGPLGSKKRKILTAIGETVDNASRLECSGRGNHIHTTREIVDILENAWISKDTRLIHRITEPTPSQPSQSFLEFYKTRFKLGHDFAVESGRADYKEFSMAHTCLIPCLPNHGAGSTCSGI